MASSLDLAANAGLSPEKSPEAVEVITESRARGARADDGEGRGSEELLGQSTAITPNHEENAIPLWSWNLVAGCTSHRQNVAKLFKKSDGFVAYYSTESEK